MNNRGFTLIEMLLAVVIFAAVGLASVAVLNTVVQNDASSKVSMDQLQQVQRAMLVMERDFWQIVPRQVRVNGEAPTKLTLAGAKNFIESDDDGITFVQGGWTNPGMVLPRSEVQLVGYRLKAQKLERVYYIFPDAVTGTEPKVQVLLTDVEELKIQYLAQQTDQADENANAWQSQWDSEKWPKAIKLTLKSPRLGVIERVFVPPAGGRP